jgi:SAM-dependent methyltransferase
MPYRSLFTSRGAKYLGADIEGAPDILMDSTGDVAMADESADFVVSFQVLEHVRNVPAHLAMIRRLLRAGGRMFLSTHGVWPYHPHPTDYWRWTRDGLLVTLEDAGFTVEKTSALCGPATWIPMFPLLVGKSVLGRWWPVLAPVNLAINLLASAADRLTPAAVRDNNAAIFAVEVSKTT